MESGNGPARDGREQLRRKLWVRTYNASGHATPDSARPALEPTGVARHATSGMYLGIHLRAACQAGRVRNRIAARNFDIIQAMDGRRRMAACSDGFIGHTNLAICIPVLSSLHQAGWSLLGRSGGDSPRATQSAVPASLSSPATRTVARDSLQTISPLNSCVRPTVKAA